MKRKMGDRQTEPLLARPSRRRRCDSLGLDDETPVCLLPEPRRRLEPARASFRRPGLDQLGVGRLVCRRVAARATVVGRSEAIEPVECSYVRLGLGEGARREGGRGRWERKGHGLWLSLDRGRRRGSAGLGDRRSSWSDRERRVRRPRRPSYRR